MYVTFRDKKPLVEWRPEGAVTRDPDLTMLVMAKKVCFHRDICNRTFTLEIEHLIALNLLRWGQICAQPLIYGVGPTSFGGAFAECCLPKEFSCPEPPI